MPDSTTPAKGLTQPTVGQDENTWGGLLNDNLALIDQALGGHLTLSISGDTTLTSTQAKNTGYEFTGTLTADATITWPSFSGWVSISNATTGSFSIICAISGAAVTILDGEALVLWSNGTDFVRLTAVGGGLQVPLFGIENANAGQALVFNSSNGKWTNQIVGATVVTVVSIATDNVDISTPTPDIGGADLTDNDRVALFGQTDPVENGIYTFVDGEPLVRAPSMPEGTVEVAGSRVFTANDGDNADIFYVLSSPSSAVVGTDGTTWAPASGAIYPRAPGTFLAGPGHSGHWQPEDWRTISAYDLPSIKNGSTNFSTGGVTTAYQLFRRGRFSGYRRLRTPFDDAGALTAALSENSVVELDVPRLYIGTSISALSNKTLICNGNGAGGPVTLFVTTDTNVFNLASVTNFKVIGTLVIKYQSQASTANTVNITGTSSDIDIERLVVINGHYGVRCVGTISKIRIGWLDLVNFNGIGLYTTGTDSTHQATNILVEKLTWVGTGSNAIAVETDSNTGGPGLPGVTVLYGSGTGHKYGYYQTGSSTSTAPRGCTIGNWTGLSASSREIWIEYSQGKTLVDNARSYGAGDSGMRFDSNISGSVELRSPVAENAQNYGIQILNATAAERYSITNVRIKSCSQSGSNTKAGLRMETSVANVSIIGGVIGDNGGTPIQKYGIDTAGVVPPNSLIMNVDLRGNVTAATNPTSLSGTSTALIYCMGKDWT